MGNGSSNASAPKMQTPVTSIGGHNVSLNQTAQGNGYNYNPNTQSLQKNTDWKKLAGAGLMAAGQGMKGGQNMTSGGFQPSYSNTQYQQTPDAKTFQSGAGAINGNYDDQTLQKFLAWQKQNGF